ncbi:HET-domain-containing protein [Annulohypoxylon moriforme]|nr:HET-domain-containing protein [Annulohypoxylon moriforme]
MLRWHREACRKPDITIVDNVLFCSSCDSAAEPSGLGFHQHSDLPVSTGDFSQSLDLRWPKSVQYSADRGADTTNPKSSSNTTNGTVPPYARWRGESNISADISNAHSRLDGRFYAPLAQKYDMRLLRFSTLPSSGYLHAELDVVDLVYCPSFEALSYTWAGETGNNTTPKSIFIGPWWDMIPITVNCDLALRLLLEKGHLSIWVDSICINQQDPLERSHQVTIMREIYSKASRVLVYLGPSANYSDEAIDALHSLARSRPDEPEALNDTQKLGLKYLFERRYFYRIWVIQEIAMAKSITFYCGNKGISYPSSSQIRIPYRYIREVAWLLQHIEGGSAVMKDPEDLLQLLDATSKCAASDPRDNVFAVLGLLRDGIFEGLVPDYCLSTKQVYIGIASYLICHHNKTELLAYPKGHSRSLPSWVPDWSLFREPKTLVDADADDMVPFNTQLYFSRRKEITFEEIETHPNPISEENECFQLYYSEDLEVLKTTTADTVWLKSGHTSWTLFTTNKTQSPCVRHISQHLVEKDAGTTFDRQPTVDASTGALTIKCNIIATFDSFKENDQGEFVQTVPFPGIQGEFQWILDTGDNIVDINLDVVGNISGCDSYLHLRKTSTADDYIILGTCRIGFRQGVVRTAPTSTSNHKFSHVDSNRHGLNTIDIDILGRPLHSGLLCASYGFDISFIQFLDSILESELGKFVLSCHGYQGAGSGHSLIKGVKKTLTDNLKLSSAPLWKTISGWRTIVHGVVDAQDKKDMCNQLTELLEFWSKPTTWQVLDAIKMCMDSIEELTRILSIWNQVARSLATIETREWSWNFDERPDMISSHFFEHNIEPQIATTLGLSEYSASLPCLISALDQLTVMLTQHLECHSDLFNDSVLGVDIQGMGPHKESLSSTERIQVGRLYTNFMRNKTQTPNTCSQNPLLTLGTEAFYSKVQTRVAMLKWLRPSWQLFQDRLVEFRQVCQHMLAIDAFQKDIDETRRITIV